MAILLILSLLLIGCLGYYLMIRDIKDPTFNSQNLINRPYYWLLLFFIGGLTTLSVGVLASLLHLSAGSTWPIIVIGSILMVLYLVSFLFIPRRYFIAKYRA